MGYLFSNQALKEQCGDSNVRQNVFILCNLYVYICTEYVPNMYSPNTIEQQCASDLWRLEATAGWALVNSL